MIQIWDWGLIFFSVQFTFTLLTQQLFSICCNERNRPVHFIKVNITTLDYLRIKYLLNSSAMGTIKLIQIESRDAFCRIMDVVQCYCCYSHALALELHSWSKEHLISTTQIISVIDKQCNNKNKDMFVFHICNWVTIMT